MIDRAETERRMALASHPLPQGALRDVHLILKCERCWFGWKRWDPR